MIKKLFILFYYNHNSDRIKSLLDQNLHFDKNVIKMNIKT